MSVTLFVIHFGFIFGTFAAGCTFGMANKERIIQVVDGMMRSFRR